MWLFAAESTTYVAFVLTLFEDEQGLEPIGLLLVAGLLAMFTLFVELDRLLNPIGASLVVVGLFTELELVALV